MNLILYPVPPTKLLQVHFSIYVNTSHLFSPAPQLIRISSYEPYGNLFGCKSIANELDDLLNWDSGGSLTLSRS